jgi:hypothetical protein
MIDYLKNVASDIRATISVLYVQYNPSTGFSFTREPEGETWATYNPETKAYFYQGEDHFLMGVPPNKYFPNLKVRFEPLREYFDPRSGQWIVGGAKTGWWSL